MSCDFQDTEIALKLRCLVDLVRITCYCKIHKSIHENMVNKLNIILRKWITLLPYVVGEMPYLITEQASVIAAWLVSLRWIFRKL